MGKTEFMREALVLKVWTLGLKYLDTVEPRVQI